MKSSASPLKLKDGILFKQRDHFKENWEPRYFVLGPDFLHYYRNYEQVLPSNSLIIDSSVVVSLEGNFPLTIFFLHNNYIYVKKRNPLYPIELYMSRSQLRILSHRLGTASPQRVEQKRLIG